MNQEQRMDDHVPEFQEKTASDVIEYREGRREERGIGGQGFPYDVFMKEENIPIYRGIGLYDARQLPMGPWQRMGGQGSFIELDGQTAYFGVYVVEVPPGGVLNPERHIYEEVFFVVEGRGSTEVWREGSAKKQTFEWQGGSIFGVPLNVWHRLVNATTSPAVVLAFTTASTVMDSFPKRSYVFENSYEFWDRYDEREDYYKPRDVVESQEGGGYRGFRRTNLLPDIAKCWVPRDNTRAPGQGHFSLREMAGNVFLTNSIFEYPSGRYSTGHAHLCGRILVCLKGKGYSNNWPMKLSKRPWEAGMGHLVNHQDYIPGGMVTAAVGSGDWFHQHFSTAKESLRLMRVGTRRNAYLDERNVDLEEWAAKEIKYPEEDPQVLKEYKKHLRDEGAKFTMPESVYRK